MFSELFVDFWISSYKKAPKPTSIASVLSLLIAIAGSYLSIITLDKVSQEKLDKRQSYAEQLTLLDNTEKNLNDLSDFITAKKGEIETTKILLKGLEDKKLELEPIVNANQKTVDAIFLQQKRELEEGVRAERGISFGLGILASLLASLIWHFVARLKKKE
jgi:sensor c-di-GMP phosphodiesterase-like protein